MKTSKIINPFSIIIIPLLLISFTTDDSKSEYNIPRAAYSITTADLESDSDMDIIIGHLYNFSTEWSGISIMTNDGEASFQIDTAFLYDHHWDILAAKIDNDNKYDIITQGMYNQNYAIAVLYNIIETTSNIQYLYLNHYPDHISLGDFNGDSFEDIVFCNNLDKIWGTLYNDTTGNFSPPQYHSVSDYYPTDIACGDLNGDGREDIVIGGKIEIFFSYPSGFQSYFFDIISGHIELIDFDFDGDIDIISAHQPLPSNYFLITMIENLGNENFSVHDPFVFQPLCHFHFTTSDFNNDSLPDLLFHPINHENLLIFFNKGNFDIGDSLFIPMADYGETTRRSACADFDGNGYNDIVTIRSWGAPLPANVNILFNDGQGNFQENPITGTNSSDSQNNKSMICYPNPMKYETNFEIKIKKTARVELTVYDMQGKSIIKLFNNKLEGGLHNIKWDGVDQNNRPCNPGLYFACLAVNGKFHQVIKLIII